MATWPDNFPPIEADGYGETWGQGGVRTSMDAGPAFQRPRYTATVETINCRIRATREQYAAFKTFWHDELLHGTQRFDGQHPVTGEIATLRFRCDQPPSPNGINGKWFNVPLPIEIIQSWAPAELPPLDYALTRNSTGSYIDASRSLAFADANVARIGYDPVSGERLGLLIEEQDTNEYRYNADPNSWDKDQVTVEETQQRRGLTLARVVPDDGFASTSPGGIRCESGNLVPGADYTFSFYVEMGEIRYIRTRRSSGSTNPTQAALFDLGTGTAESLGQTPVGMIDLRNGLYRCWFEFRAGPDASGAAGYYILNDPQSPGNGESGFWLGGVQIERATRFSSVIETIDSEQTRAPDIADATPEAGPQTWYIECRASADPGEPTLFSLPGTRVYQSGGRLEIDGSGTLYQDAPSGGVEPGERIRAFWIGDPGGDDVAIGRDQSDDNYWNGHVEPPRVYGGVLNASQIKGLLQ